MYEAVFIKQTWKAGKLVPSCDPIHLGLFFSVSPQIQYLSSGQKSQKLFSRAQFYPSPVSCLERSFVLTCTEFWPEKPSLLYAVRYFTHATELPHVCLNKGLFNAFSQPHLLPETVDGVFLRVWTAEKGGLLRVFFRFRASKCLSHVYPQVCTAGNPIVTNIDT